MAVKIFFCYAHEDEPLLNKLKTHLSPLHRQGLIEMWHDRDITAGTKWEEEIDKHLNEANIILLLVSPDFMASDYCYGIELKRSIERHERKEACVIPVILRPVYWQDVLGKLQALPKDAKPVKGPRWHNQDEAFFDVAEGICKTIESMAMYQGASSQTTGSQGKISLSNTLQTFTIRKKPRSRCIVCFASFRDGDEVVICPSCSTPYHRDCWFAIYNCANFNCIYPVRTIIIDALSPWVTFEQGLKAGSELVETKDEEGRIIIEGKKCPYLDKSTQIPFQEGDYIAYCPSPSCRTPYHLDCWLHLEKCRLCGYDIKKLIDKAFSSSS